MKTTLLIIIYLSIFQASFGQFVANYDEDKIPVFKLPDVLETFSGKTISNKKQWEELRKPELLEFFTSNMFGKIPGQLAISSIHVVEKSDNALNGKARRRQVELKFENEGKSLTFNILIYLPKNIKNSPVFLGYNFNGNHTVNKDPEIIISNT